MFDIRLALVEFLLLVIAGLLIVIALSMNNESATAQEQAMNEIMATNGDAAQQYMDNLRNEYANNQ